jgi:hypothetical protein
MVHIQAYPYTSKRFTFAVTSLPLYTAPQTSFPTFFKVGHILLTLDSCGTFYCWRNVGMVLVGQTCGKTHFCAYTSLYIHNIIRKQIIMEIQNSVL